MPRNIDELFRLAANGDKKAETELFSTISDRFSLFAHQRVWNREVVQDLVQEAIAVVAAKYRSVNIESSFAAWAHKIMENRLLGYIQKRRREKGRVATEKHDEYLMAAWTPDPNLRMRLLNCLKEVGLANRRYARIINLHHLGYSRKEICGMLDMTLDQSYVVMSRARGMLRNCLDKGEIGR